MVQARLDDVLEAAVAGGDVPGCVAMVVDRTDTRYARSVGRRALDGEIPMALDAVFRLASMTKAVTSIAALQLIEQGRLHLEQPVASVLPEFAELGVLTGFYGEHPAIRPPRSPVTVRHLLTHTSGLAYEYWSAPLQRWTKLTGNPGVLSGKRAGLMTPLIADPGALWMYGIGTDWAGLLVEAISGQSLDRYFADHITGPLGLHDTAFELAAEQAARLVGVHARGADGVLQSIPFQRPPGHELWNGGHRLHGTAPDYARLLRMLLNRGTLDGARILAEQTVQLAHRNHIGDLLVTRLDTLAPAVTLDAEFFPGMRKQHGLAYMLTAEQWPGRRAVGSGFWAGLFNTYFWIDPTHGIAAVLMMQLLPFADARALALLDAFERAVYAELCC